jgi:NAD(P)H-hydrate epimerase
MPPTIPILSPTDVSTWDAQALAGDIPVELLMDAAGRAAAGVIAARFPSAVGEGVLVLCGGGHNGGDGWVTARALHQAGASVFVAPVVAPLAPLTRVVAERARRDGVREVSADGPWPRVGLVVDAMLGTGASGPPRAAMASVLDRVEDLGLLVVAMDGPTGVDLGTGVSHGTARAALSITFGGLRRGHLIARDEVGDVVVVDVGLPMPDARLPVLVTDAMAAAWLGRLGARDHKGVRGRVVVLGGAPGMSGAVRLAARSALAAGAGLLWTLTPAETTAILAADEPDVQPRSTALTVPLDDATRTLIQQADVVVIGPGLGRAAGIDRFVLAVLAEAKAAVVDADALTVLAASRAELASVAEQVPLVLTPHPGEFRTLFPELSAGAETDPWAAASSAAVAVGATVVLKGVPSVIAHAGAPLRTIAAGNPGLATGGSGDVLSGLIGAFLGAGLAPDVAAALGAHALGRAADLAARRTTARAMRPMDVISACADLWREWEVVAAAPPPPRPPILLELPRPRTS